MILLDRVVIAGDYTQDANRRKIRRPRWGVSMSHIARRPDEKNPDEVTEWKLLRKESLRRWFDRYCKAGMTGHILRARIDG